MGFLIPAIRTICLRHFRDDPLVVRWGIQWEALTARGSGDGGVNIYREISSSSQPYHASGTVSRTHVQSNRCLRDPPYAGYICAQKSPDQESQDTEQLLQQQTGSLDTVWWEQCRVASLSQV